ncbi:MAG: hypothetical protein ACTSSA_15390 [Candidatus Freyarchaeota archaeon]
MNAKNTKRLAAVHRGISIACFLIPLVLVPRSLSAGSWYEPMIFWLIGKGFLSTPMFVYLMLMLYMSVTFPSAMKFLLFTSSIVLVGFTTGFFGQFLWDVSPAANEFREAKDRFLVVLAKWRKEKPVKLVVGVSCLVATYLLVVIFFEAIMLPPDLNYFLVGFGSTPPHKWIAPLSCLLLIPTLSLSVWFQSRIAGDARRL